MTAIRIRPKAEGEGFWSFWSRLPQAAQYLLFSISLISMGVAGTLAVMDARNQLMSTEQRIQPIMTSLRADVDTLRAREMLLGTQVRDQTDALKYVICRIEGREAPMCSLWVQPASQFRAIIDQLNAGR